jgi:hypothetical protein
MVTRPAKCVPAFGVARRSGRWHRRVLLFGPLASRYSSRRLALNQYLKNPRNSEVKPVDDAFTTRKNA